jgi:flagellin
VTSILQRMRDLSVQAASGGLSATEKGYLDTEQSKLATTLGAVIDQAQFNGTDLVNDLTQTSKTIQTGADAGDTVSVAFKALTETRLGVSAGEINLAGTTSTKEQVTLTGVTVATNDASYKITIDGVVYSNAAEIDATMDTMMANVLAATADDGTAVSDLFTATNTGGGGASGNLVFTYIDEGAKGVTDFTLAVNTGDSTDFAANDGTAVAVSQAGASQASDAITAIDAALATVASERAALGATQAQLEATVRNLANVAENTAAAAGRIMDTDYAAETANLTKAQILQQAATSILAQANAQPQAVLSLLQ